MVNLYTVLQLKQQQEDDGEEETIAEVRYCIQRNCAHIIESVVG